MRFEKEDTIPQNLIFEPVSAASDSYGCHASINADQGSVSLRANRRNGKLILESKTASATKTTIYELSADGQTLTQQNKLQSNKLPAPIQFTNSFKR